MSIRHVSNIGCVAIHIQYIKYVCTHRIFVSLRMLVAQSCLTLWNPMDSSLPVFSVHGIFSYQGHCSGFRLPSLGDLSDACITPRSPTLQANSLLSEPACLLWFRTIVPKTFVNPYSEV